MKERKPGTVEITKTGFLLDGEYIPAQIFLTFTIALGNYLKRRAYTDGLKELGQKAREAVKSGDMVAIAKVFLQGLELPEDTFTDAFAESQFSLRLSHYPPRENLPGQYGFAPHTDANFMTFLAQSGSRAEPERHVRTRRATLGFRSTGDPDKGGHRRQCQPV